MKKLVTMLMLITVAAPLALHAEDGAPRGRVSVEDRVERLTKELKLTPEQEASVKSILTESKAKAQELAGQMTALREKSHDAIMNLLTPEQKTKYEELQKRFRTRTEQKRGEKTKK